MKKLGANISHITFFLPEARAPNSTVLSKKEVNEENKAWYMLPKDRRFAFPDYSSAELGAKAIEKLFFETNMAKDKVDLLLYSATLNDRAKVGIGPEVRKKTKMSNARVMQIDAGCSSYLSLLNVADTLLGYGPYKSAILLTVTNFISRLHDFQKNPRSLMLGDGASATLLLQGKSSIISQAQKVNGDNFGAMLCEAKDRDGQKKPFFAARPGSLQLEFARPMLRKIRSDSISLVIDSTLKCMKQADIACNNIDFFISHQPNMGLIEAWREALGFKPPHVYDTFLEFGNLFQSSIPISLAHGLKEQIIKKDHVIACAAFSNGADFSSSMIINL